MWSGGGEEGDTSNLRCSQAWSSTWAHGRNDREPVEVLECGRNKIKACLRLQMKAAGWYHGSAKMTWVQSQLCYLFPGNLGQVPSPP